MKGSEGGSGVRGRGVEVTEFDPFILLLYLTTAHLTHVSPMAKKRVFTMGLHINILSESNVSAGTHIFELFGYGFISL
jgi:hypothetical protein